MARTGRGPKVQRSDMPAMVTGLVEPTIYDYDPIGMHVPAMPHIVAGQPPKPVASAWVPSIEATYPCWIGAGRRLVSAVHKTTLAPDAFYCTRACKAAHGGE